MSNQVQPATLDALRVASLDFRLGSEGRLDANKVTGQHRPYPLRVGIHLRNRHDATESGVS